MRGSWVGLEGRATGRGAELRDFRRLENEIIRCTSWKTRPATSGEAARGGV